MSDEEKQAIEKMKEIVETFYCFPNPLCIEVKDKDATLLETLLNLIEKQQKEIKIQEDMIDEMVCELSTEGYLDDVCQMKQDNDECDDCCNLCIKEYFRKKVEENESND